MTLFNSSNDLIHIYHRDGSVENPYIDMEELLVVTQGIVFLKEIPDKFTRVIVKEGSIFLNEVDSKEEIVNNNDYFVDYKDGIVYFKPIKNNAQLTMIYKGMGVVLYPASRIYLDGENPNETLGSIVAEGKAQLENNQEQIDIAVENAEIATANAITAKDDAITAKVNAETATTNANTATSNANTATTNANNKITEMNTVIGNANTKISETETARQNAITATTNANTAKTNADTATASANTATTNAITATTNANTATTNANTATTNANNATTNATTQANYAKAQGDYAKAEGDKANIESSNLATLKSDVITATTNANTATTNANTATTNANTATTNANTATTNANNAVGALLHKGTYSGATAYVPRNIVSYNGSSYMNIVGCTNILPTDVSKWQPLGLKGDQGFHTVLSNDHINVPADSAGTVSSWSGATTTLTIYNGITDDTANWTISQALSNVTVTASGTPANRTATVTAMSADSGTVTFTATRSGYSNIVRVFTITKARQGIKGDTGNTGATGTSFIWRGAYAGATAYVINDVVSYLGSTYIAIASTTGNLPTDVSKWSPMATKGVDSAVTSVAGRTGAITLTATDVSGVETPSGSQAKADTAETNAKAYTDTKVASIVSSAPATLDTLNELSTALGNDPNFATTVTNNIASKLPLAGGTMTGSISFNDVSRYWLNTFTNFGVYWNTTDNKIEFHGNGTSKFSVDVDDGNTVVGGTITVAGDVTATSGAFRTDNANAFQFLTVSGSAQQIRSGSLLASSSYTDSTKVPTNGAYIKGSIVTDGILKATKNVYQVTFAIGETRKTITHNIGSANYMVTVGANSVARHVAWDIKMNNTVDIIIDESYPYGSIVVDVIIIGY